MPSEEVTEPTSELREVTEFPNITIMRSKMPVEPLVRRGVRGQGAPQARAETSWRARSACVSVIRSSGSTTPWRSRPSPGTWVNSAIVFDCMDQLSQFKGAPKELLRRERELLAIADVVFAGGPKIGRDKIKYNANTHSYGCGVDVKHFGTARSKNTQAPRRRGEPARARCSDSSAWWTNAWITSWSPGWPTLIPRVVS